VGDGDPSSDAVSAGAEPFGRRGDRAAGNGLCRHCGDSDRFSAYNHLATSQRQQCWAHLIRDLNAIAERQGVSGEIGLELLGLQKQLFAQWHQWKDGTIDSPTLQLSCRPIRLQFKATLQRVVDQGFARKERTPWAQTVRTCQQLMQRKEPCGLF
jgi:hypothetical protein